MVDIHANQVYGCDGGVLNVGVTELELHRTSTCGGIFVSPNSFLYHNLAFE